SRKYSRLPGDVVGPLHPVEIVRPVRPRVARLPAIVRLASPSWSAPVKGSTMWPTFPESSAHTHPSPETSRGFVRKTSCCGAHTKVPVELGISRTRTVIAMRGSVMPRTEAPAHESLSRAFEIRRDSCRRAHRQARRERPARLSRRDGEFENIQFQEPECLS